MKQQFMRHLAKVDRASSKDEPFSLASAQRPFKDTPRENDNTMRMASPCIEKLPTALTVKDGTRKPKRMEDPT
ncbi:hypothetical protein [endosymbiont of unidentified scaly snail isolate Monju]|uniref:hypothetical protein n=1 Tax=endosymbiont of unidentified scaly snail isolate Monju TaxID=1248727 RepID=UPI0011DCA276|nr:hypothetical protein [endosymbiont of unidentified scaly snail isolate Monju]